MPERKAVSAAPGWQLVPHRWVVNKHLPRQLCASCGLVRLRNRLTDWCVSHGCDHDEHPGYRTAIQAAVARGRELALAQALGRR